MDNQLDHIKGIIAIVIACFLWGTTGTAASFSPETSPLAIGAFATGTAGILLMINARHKLYLDYSNMLNQRKLLLVGAISVAIYPLAFYSAMRLSGVAIGTVVSIAAAPFFAALLERLISKKQISQLWLISFIIGALGIALLTLGKVPDKQSSASFYQQNMEILLACIAALAYASYSWVARQFIEQGVDSRSAMSGIFACAALLLLPSLYFTGDKLFSSTTNSLIALYMAIIPMFFGYLLFGFGLKFIHASKATLITLLEPLIATLLAVVIVGEKFNTIAWLGAALITLCLLMQTFSKHQIQEN